ncbi:hypothetical protein OSB04_016123 [Centaurea solstitialis]|uniref:NB-ARC domain-containing protein n=1 Tax=Centaurea solstitialis TaxID=347529 RepID=A0AA38T834_9ASTR|nr:hypothetical protein OSB04_016123 [Centaurea solstitialis]
MAYTAGFQMLLMENLKKLIHGNHHPFINNNPLILSERPQFQLLYQELDSIIQTLFSIHEDHHHNPDEIEKVRNLKERFKDVVEEAQDIIDLFVSAVHFTNRQFPPEIDVFKTSLNLEKVLKSIESIKVELMTINIGNMKMDSSSRIDHVKTQSVAAAAVGTSYTRNRLGTKMVSSEEIVVGLDHDVKIIRDKLTEETKQLGVVSIVGMGGLGKTTIANKIFNDRFVVYYFHVRAWVTVSQTYAKRDLLIQILRSIGVQGDLEEDDDSKLRGKLHKNLMGRRYLIVIDDIWSIEAWDELKMFFPHDNTASRILLTTRLYEVALHVKPHGFVHSLPCLTEEESWKLLKQKVFHGDECPEWLIKPGMQIAKKCHGLPLSVVVMAGVLAKEPMNKDLWEEIACSVSSYIVGDHKGCLETLALSYHHLPNHLRECFLYLGGFPEDFRFTVERIIWLWVAEGFIEEAGNRSLEDVAEAYLMDLISRNLVIVAGRKFNGDVKAYSPPFSSQLLEVYKQRRVFTNQDINNIAHSLTRTAQSLLCFHDGICWAESIGGSSFVLLKVLDLQKCRLHDFPQGLRLLIHLRYLAICYSGEFPNLICKLWSLQTLILRTNVVGPMHLPHNIQDLVNLRHLWSDTMLFFPSIEKPMNLQYISNVVFKDGMDNFRKCFPSLKKLALRCDKDDEYHFELLPCLENLKLAGLRLQHNHISFPATLKKLTLAWCDLPWSDMSTIQLLPNLEALQLKGYAPEGAHWDACDQQFQKLKFLKLEWLNIKQWKASSTSFPCLKRLAVCFCWDLQEIPLEIGEIATLDLIITDSSSNSVVKSVKRIQEEQHDVGNYELKIIVDGMELSYYLSHPGGSWREWTASFLLRLLKRERILMI